MLVKKVIVATVAAAMCLAGCRGVAKSGEVVNKSVQRTVDLRVKGVRQVTFKGGVGLRVVTRNGAREQVEFNVAALEMNQPIVLASGTVAVEIGMTGLYKGNGRYVMPRGIGLVKPTTGTTVEAESSAGTGATGLGNVSVLFYDGPPETPTNEVRFGYLLERCEIRLKDQATRGEIHCPALLDAKGDRVSLDMTWS